jgi:hypothetical protein
MEVPEGQQNLAGGVSRRTPPLNSESPGGAAEILETIPAPNLPKPPQQWLLQIRNVD